MLFHIFGEIIWDDYLNNCIETCKYEEARKVKGIRIDRRTVDTPEKILCYNGNKKLAYEDWYSEGKNHRVVNGMIERDFDEEFFVIEINTIDDLLNFQNKYDVIATVSPCKSQFVYNDIELNSFFENYIME